MSPNSGAVQSERYLVFYDDARARTFEPFALSRPLCEMRVGALLLRERWEMALRGGPARFVGAPHLADFTEDGALRCEEAVIPANTVLINSRAAISLARTGLGEKTRGANASTSQHRAWFLNGALAAFMLSEDLDVPV